MITGITRDNLSNFDVKFIRLGKRNIYAQECIDQGKLILGFWSGQEQMHRACLDNDWDRVSSLLVDYRTEKKGKPPKSIVDDLRQVQDFFDRNTSTIWLTFRNGEFFWTSTTLKDRSFGKRDYGNGNVRTFRKASIGWRKLDSDDLPEEIRMVRRYRGTICNVREPQILIEVIVRDLGK